MSLPTGGPGGSRNTLTSICSSRGPAAAPTIGHDPWAHHAHCVDPREPERDDHYRDVPVDVFEAHAEFLRWYALNAQMNCFGLFPLVR